MRKGRHLSRPTGRGRKTKKKKNKTWILKEEKAGVEFRVQKNVRHLSREIVHVNPHKLPQTAPA